MPDDNGGDKLYLTGPITRLPITPETTSLQPSLLAEHQLSLK